MLDIAVAYNRYKFIGCEFLTWLWFIIEKDQTILKDLENELIALDIGNRIVLENNTKTKAEIISIKGDDAGLEEGIIALKKGAVVTELNLIYNSGGHKWRFTLKGESFNICSLTSPDTGSVEEKEDIEGAVLEKIFLYNKVIELTDKLFSRFIKLRVSTGWDNNTVPLLKKWIYS